MKTELSNNETASSQSGTTYLRSTVNNNILAEYDDGTKYAIAGKTMPLGKFSFTVDVQGDTGTASEISIKSTDLEGNKLAIAGNLLRVRVCNDGTLADSTNATIAAANGSAVADTITATKDLVLSSVAATAATGTLTISGVVIDGETVVINGRTYEFRTGKTTLSGDVSVDISADGTKSAGTLTMDTQPTAGDTVTIGATNYTWRTDGTADEAGEINLGADLAEAKTNFVAAVNGTDANNAANAQVTAAAFSGDDSVITAKYTGTQGDAIATTETFTAGTNVFDAATLGTTTPGVDVSATDAGDALVTALAGDASALVSGSNSTGTVTLTSAVTHADANAYTTTETMANGAFGAGTMSGGITVRNNTWKLALTDATEETVRLVIGPPPVGQGIVGDYSAEIDVLHETA
jgi:hypothetical protein